MNRSKEDRCWMLMVRLWMQNPVLITVEVVQFNMCKICCSAVTKVQGNLFGWSQGPSVAPSMCCCSPRYHPLTSCGGRGKEVINIVEDSWDGNSDMLHKTPFTVRTPTFPQIKETNTSWLLRYLKNLGWCVSLFSSRTFLLSLCSSSIRCLCSSAASKFPVSSSLPAEHIHYAEMLQHSSIIYKCKPYVLWI